MSSPTSSDPPAARPWPESLADEVDEPGVLIPAATVMLLRDGADGLETLMVRRNSKLAFAAGMWVWPGGRVDPEDEDPEAPDDHEGAARRAAAREAFEEAGVAIDPTALAWFAHWTPPAIRSHHRFATFFFAGQAHDDATITLDGGEIHEHVWIGPTEAMRRRNALEIELAPPTWITLERLATYTDSTSALDDLHACAPEYFATRLAVVDGGAVALYHGDAGYETSDANLAGGRHRLWMLESGWRYERDSVAP
jgi:8-oxo-dGTP pyrophosphatase MutT (NUDIX family)